MLRYDDILPALLDGLNQSTWQSSQGQWETLSDMPVYALEHACNYSSMVASWYAHKGENLDFEYHRLVDLLSEEEASKREVASQFVVSLIGAQLVARDVPESLIAAITKHPDESLFNRISYASRYICKMVEYYHPKLLKEYSSSLLDRRALERWYDANDLTGSVALRHYALNHDNPDAIDIYIDNDPEIRRLVLKDLYGREAESCPRIRERLFGQAKGPIEEILHRLEVALTNTDERSEELAKTDFNFTISKIQIENHLEKINDILGEFASWGNDNHVTRKMLMILDKAGYEWNRLIQNLSDDSRLVRAEKWLPESPLNQPMGELMVLCLESMSNRPQMAAVFACLSAHESPLNILELIKSNDELLLRAYQQTGESAFLRAVTTEHKLDDALSTDLGL